MTLSGVGPDRVAFGYANAARLEPGQAQVIQAAMREWAHTRHGLTLTTMMLDSDYTGRRGFVFLCIRLEAARQDGAPVGYVVVPAVEHFSTDPTMCRLMRTDVECALGAELLVMHDGGDDC